jgi:hypothetical protein
MTDKFANMPKTVRHFWVVAFSPSAAPEERAKALKGIDGYLREIGADGYEVIRRVETEPVSDEDLQRMCDVAIARDRAEQQRNTAVATGLGNVGRSSVYGFSDTGRVAGHDTHNGYAWGAIAEHCYVNLNRIPIPHRGFVTGMADQLVSFGGTISGKQAKYLNSLFTRYLSGRI